MARFMTIQEGTELDSIAGRLKGGPWFHTPARDIKMQDTFRTRQEKWLEIYFCLERDSIHAVLISSKFIEQDVLTSGYLLAPIRRFEEQQGRNIKIALILPTVHPFVLKELTDPVDYVALPILDRRTCAQLRDIINQQIQQLQLVGPIIFVEDSEAVRTCLATYMTPGTFGDRQIHIMGFDEAHQTLFEQELPSVMAIDLVEYLGGGALGPFTGLGLFVVIRSTPGLRGNITPILYTSRLRRGPALRAFDGVFVDDDTLEPKLNDFLANIP
jgi:hypothetical protein